MRFDTLDLLWHYEVIAALRGGLSEEEASITTSSPEQEEDFDSIASARNGVYDTGVFEEYGDRSFPFHLLY